MPEPGMEPGTSCTPSGCVTTAPPSQLRVSIVVKLFNCFDAMGRNVNKQSWICAVQTFSTNSFFQPYFDMHEYLNLAVSHIYGSRFHFLNMIKMWDENKSNLNDTTKHLKHIFLFCMPMKDTQDCIQTSWNALILLRIRPRINHCPLLIT